MSEGSATTNSTTARWSASALGNRVVEWMTGAERATYSFSALRIIYGLAMLWFLVVSAADRHYLWGIASRWVEPAVDRRGYPWFFKMFPKDDAFTFDLAYGILIVLALLFTVGIATRIVTPILLLFWVGLSTNSVFLTNGGDVVMRITLLFCVFANLSVHWSFDAWWRRRSGNRSMYPRSVTQRIPRWLITTAHNTALVLCAYQLILIYVNSGIFKLLGDEWLQGSALYYALNLEVFRVFPALSDFAWQVTPFVVVGSWISIWAQLLFPVLLLWRPTRYATLIVLMGMHLGIGLFLGLWPFSMAMIALDLLFVRDASWRHAFAWSSNAWRSMRARIAARSAVAGVPASSGATEPALERVGETEA